MGQNSGSLAAVVIETYPQEDDSWKKPFLEELARTGLVATAAVKVEMPDLERIYNLRLNDPQFAQAWDLAMNLYYDDMERIAVQRAKDGSDKLMMFLLAGYRPQFRPQSRRSIGVDADDKEVKVRIVEEWQG